MGALVSLPLIFMMLLTQYFRTSLLCYFAVLVIGDAFLGPSMNLLQLALRSSVRGQATSMLLGVAALVGNLGPAMVGILDPGGVNIGIHLLWICSAAQVFAALSFLWTANEITLDPVWLQLEWNSSGHAMEYWYDPDSGESKWTMPSAPDLTSDLSKLEEAIETLASQVQALATLIVQEKQQQQQQSHAVLDSHHSAAEAAAATTQLLRGSNADAMPDSFFGATAVAPVTFQPEELGPSAHEENVNPLRRRPPGHLPWATFQQGTFALLGIWAIGVVWAIVEECRRELMTLYTKGARNHESQEAWRVVVRPNAGGFNRLFGRLVRSDELHLDLLHTPSWPHGHFRPQGLACGAQWGNRLFVAERYAVHELLLPIGPRITTKHHGTRSAVKIQEKWHPAVQSCLQEVPKFLAAGLRSVTMRCEEECFLVLLGSTGDLLLSCPLGLGNATLAELLGGPWQAIASSASSGRGSGLWAKSHQAQFLLPTLSKQCSLGKSPAMTNRPPAIDIDLEAEETSPLKVEINLQELLKEYGKRLEKIEQWQLQQDGRLDTLPAPAESRKSIRPTSPGSRMGRVSTKEHLGLTAEANPALLRSISRSGEVKDEPIAEVDGNHPFSQMWLNSKLQKKEIFDQDTRDLLQSIYDKSIQRVRNKAAVFGGGLMAILSMPFGPIGMAAGGIFGALVGMLVGTCLDRRRHHRNIQQSELEMRRLKSLVRWSAERFADDDPAAAVQHMEMVVLEFRPIADIAMASKNARRTLQLLDSWASRRSMMRQVWVYMDNILMNWKNLTQAEFFRSMPGTQGRFWGEFGATRARARPREGRRDDFHPSRCAQSTVPYFYAIDRNRDGKLDFQEFFLGSVAADPQTVHILNSFTGRERANFTFDYYDVNRSGFLELEEFQKVCRDCALPSLDEHALRRHTFEKARDLGLMEESQRRGRVLDDESSFIPPNQKQFYEFISTERLRGTSRLFRFQKTLIKQRSRPKRAVLAPEPVDGTELPPAEGDTEDATTEEPSDYEDVDGLFFDNEESPRIASQDWLTL
eukprot:g12237.t1